MRITAIAVATAALLLTGCDPVASQQGVDSCNRGALKNPIQIGTTSEGESIFRYEVQIFRGEYAPPDIHYIYRFESNKTATVNREIQVEKTMQLQVTVLVDGQPATNVQVEVNNKKE